MRGLLLFISMIFFAGSMYFFYHPEFLNPALDSSITGSAIDTRPLLEKITESIHKPVSIADVVQMAPVIFLFFSILFAFASVLIPYGER